MSLIEDIRDTLLGRMYERPHIDLGTSAEEPVNPTAAYYRSRIELSSGRVKKYKDYVDMGQDTLVSGALDIYGEESTQFDPIERASIWVSSPNKDIEYILRSMLDRVELEDHVFGISRYLAQMGDNFVRPLYNKEEGIVNLEFLDAEDCERVVDRHGRLTGFKLAGTSKPLDPWSFIQFRILGRTQTVRHGGGLYGTSMLENARRTWRQLTLLEDSLVIYRLEIGTRHRVFYIDVGNLNLEQAMATARRYRREFGKRQYYNPNSGEWNSRFNPLNFTADLFWPVRKGSESRIDYIGTDPNIAGIADIDYFRAKLFSALKIPQAYLGGDAYASTRTGLAMVDVAFARFVSRNQRAIKRGVTRLCQIHLALKGIDPMDINHAFTVEMGQISTLDQQQRIEALGMSVDLSIRLRELGGVLGIPEQGLSIWIAKNILGLTQVDFAAMQLAPEAGAQQPSGQNSQVNNDQGQQEAELTPEQQGELMREAYKMISDDPSLQKIVKDLKSNSYSSSDLNEAEDGPLPSQEDV